MNAPTHARLTARLVEHSSKVEELTLAVRGVIPTHPLAPELLDELAVTVDELLLTLDEHRHACGSDALVESLMADARALMRGVRTHSLAREQVAEAADGVAQCLRRVIRQDKYAA